MKRNFLYLLVISLFSVVFTLPAVSQTATVHGVCKDSKGNPIVGAQVTWHNEDNGRTFNLKTNKKGEYFSLGIDPGKYTVTLSKDGKQIDKVNNYSVGVDEVDLPFDEKQAQEQEVQQTAKEKGISEEQVKQMQAEQAKAEAYNKNIGAVNDKLKAATADEQATPPNYDGAIATLNEAAQMVPNEDLVWFRLGGAYLDSAKTVTDPADRTKRNAEAYNDLQKAIDLLKAKDGAALGGQPPAPENATNGQAAAPPPPPASAPKNPVQLAQDKQKLAAYYDNFAAAAARVGKPEDAVNAYEQAAQLDPTRAGQYYFNLGAVLTNTNTNNDSKVRKEAVDAFDKAIAANPNQADAYFWKGQNLIGMATTDKDGKIVAPDGTTEAYQKYLELQPNGPHAEEAKQMLAALNTTVETSYGKKGTKKK
ncbi:MAG TPA: carboxypeptidase regulatory-like domain-containing protein [Terriglobales bacterium]|nr:carboxypeptidase regulatory-like domain-containing protein [Terriglobales bacterium]